MQRKKRATKVNTLDDLGSSLSKSLIERDAEINAVLLGLVAREHVLLIGPPGTAKSLLATSTTAAIKEARSFQVLLTKFTAPEELFGPIKLSALKEDRYERSTQGYAPEAHILFVDEIWKASSAILNTTLTLLQERAFDNGGVRMDCPLRLAIAASNEWPSTEDGEELGAIFDRFLIRRVVRPVSPAGRVRLLYESLPRIKPCISLGEIDKAADEAMDLPIGEAARATLNEILDKLASEGIRPGDRRIRKCVGVARAAARILGEKEVKPVHLEYLSDVLWAAPEQRDKCVDIVTRLANPVSAKLNVMLQEADEILSSVSDAASRMAAIKKLEELEVQASELAEEGNGRAQKATQYMRSSRVRLTAAALGIPEDKGEI